MRLFKQTRNSFTVDDCITIKVEMDGLRFTASGAADILVPWVEAVNFPEWVLATVPNDN